MHKLKTYKSKCFIFYGYILVFASLALFSSTASFADDKHENSATHKMAEIMHRLKHYPSPLGKEVLNGIIQAKDTTVNERVIATAMLNLQHSVADSDVPKLKAIMASKKSTAHERELAGIIVSLNHRPTNQDKAQLKAMMM